ncbi:unnamed protein product [Effrenium voratum]|nr:unnamed protein product [Effrenium voratum]
MPGRWIYATDPQDVEESTFVLPAASGLTFDGFWEATMATADGTCGTVVIISGQNVWHEGSRFAGLKVLNVETCVLIMDDEDVRGYLSADCQAIEWEDGDCWQRTSPPASGMGCKQPATADVFSEVPGKAGTKKACAEDDIVTALTRRDAVSLLELLDAGVTPEAKIKASPIWQDMRWTPEGPDQTMPLLVAAILLQWSEGVHICVQRGANVNGTYDGPFRGLDGRTVQESGAPMLRVALSAQGPVQCTICQHILAGKVRGRTFQAVRRKAKARPSAGGLLARSRTPAANHPR